MSLGLSLKWRVHPGSPSIRKKKRNGKRGLFGNEKEVRGDLPYQKEKEKDGGPRTGGRRGGKEGKWSTVKTNGEDWNQN